MLALLALLSLMTLLPLSALRSALGAAPALILTLAEGAVAQILLFVDHVASSSNSCIMSPRSSPFMSGVAICRFSIICSSCCNKSRDAGLTLRPLSHVICDSGLVDVSRRTCFTTNARAISRVTSTIPFDPLTNFG